MKNINRLLCLGCITTATLLPLSEWSPRAGINMLAANAADGKTYSFDGEIVKIWSVAKHKGTDAKVTVVNIHIDTGNAEFEEIRVRFDEASGKAEHAWWMTTGLHAIALPKTGLLLKDMPALRSDVKVSFDRDLPDDVAAIAGMGLVSLTAQKPPAATPIN